MRLIRGRKIKGGVIRGGARVTDEGETETACRSFNVGFYCYTRMVTLEMNVNKS